MEPTNRIYVAGHTGLLGRALVRRLADFGCSHPITRPHAELDLTDYGAARAFFEAERPEYVFLAAALVGGVFRNRTYPAEMLQVNLAIQHNVIDLCWRHAVRRLIFVGSACAYPREAPSPITPDMLLTGPVEPTNEPFAVAKIAGIRMCQAYNAQYQTRFLTAIPATLYGPYDHFDQNGHVVAGLMDRFHRAKLAGDAEVEVWGTGRPRREFVYCDDAADALILLARQADVPEVTHVAEGADVSIAELADGIRSVVGYSGRIRFDTSKPDGMPRRQMEASPIAALGWKPRVDLQEGLRRTYAWYLEHRAAE